MPLVLALHGGLDPLPAAVLRAIAERSRTLGRLVDAGCAVAVPTRAPLLGPRGLRGAVGDTLAALDALGDAGIDTRALLLFGSSGGADLALAVSAALEPLALVIEEPASSIITGVLDASSVATGAEVGPRQAWPDDALARYTDARRAATRSLLLDVGAPVLLAVGDQRLDGVDPRSVLDQLLIPEMLECQVRFAAQVYPGLPHGQGMIAGVAPDPFPESLEPVLSKLFDDVSAFFSMYVGDH